VLFLHVELHQPGRQPKTYDFNSQSTRMLTIGNMPSAPICLHDPHASRIHSTIQMTDEHATIIDMGTVHGTYLNDEKVKKKELRNKDTVKIGGSTLSISLETRSSLSPADLMASLESNAAPVQPEHVPVAPAAPMTPQTANPWATPSTPPTAQAPNQADPHSQLTTRIKNLTPEQLQQLTGYLSILEGGDAASGQTLNAGQSDWASGAARERYDTDLIVTQMGRERSRNRMITLLGIGFGVIILGYYVWHALQQPPSIAAEQSASSQPNTNDQTTDALAERTKPYLLKHDRVTLQKISELVWTTRAHDALLLAVNPQVTSLTQQLETHTRIRVPKHTEHIVQRGETLGGLAASLLGDPSRYEEIVQANSETLSDPSALELGMVLRIPLLHDRFRQALDDGLHEAPPKQASPAPAPAPAQQATNSAPAKPTPSAKPSHLGGSRILDLDPRTIAQAHKEPTPVKPKTAESAQTPTNSETSGADLEKPAQSQPIQDGASEQKQDKP